MKGQLASSSPSQAEARVDPPKADSPESRREERVLVAAAKPAAPAEIPKVVEEPKEVHDCVGKTFDHITPELLDSLSKKYPGLYADYKVQRLNEMACMWKGKKFEPYTVRLMAMLLVENGAIDEKVRGDHGYAFGLTQEHICKRGLNMAYLGAGDGVKTFCYWKGDKAPWDQVEEKFPEFSNNWLSQFFYFSQYISPMIDSGSDASDIVYAWNRNEAGRQGKVDGKEPFVKAALGL